MTTEQQLATLDREAKAAKAKVELGLALDKLRGNRDFNKLIVETYLKDEAVRLVHAKADAALQSPAHQDAIIRGIDAIGALEAFFNTVRQAADMAKRTLDGIEDTRADILAGDD